MACCRPFEDVRFTHVTENVGGSCQASRFQQEVQFYFGGGMSLLNSLIILCVLLVVP